MAVKPVLLVGAAAAGGRSLLSKVKAATPGRQTLCAAWRAAEEWIFGLEVRWRTPLLGLRGTCEG